MKKSLIPALLVLVITIVMTGVAGYGIHTWLHRDNTFKASLSIPSKASLSIPSPEFSMLDLKGKMRDIREWKGKVVLLNFWATWCPPCREEIPELIKLQKTYGAQGLQVVGVAVDDDKAVRKFAASENFNYPIMPGGTDAVELSRRYGDKQGVLPFSVFINREGEIKLVMQGALNENSAENILAQFGIHS